MAACHPGEGGSILKGSAVTIIQNVETALSVFLGSYVVALTGSAVSHGCAKSTMSFTEKAHFRVSWLPRDPIMEVEVDIEDNGPKFSTYRA